MVAEIALRILAHVQIPPSPMFVMDDKTGIRVRPGLSAPGGIVTNQGGFNDREPAEPHPSAVFIGDSFTFGTAPWANVFPHLVEKDLAAKSFRVVNAGVPMTGPYEYRRMVEHVALPLKPDFVVVTIFIGNDIRQSEPDMQTLPLLGSGRMLQPPGHFPTSWQHSYLGRAVAKGVRKLGRSAQGCSGVETAVTNDFLRDVYQAELDIYARATGGQPALVRELLAHIAALNETILRAGGRPLFVLAPSEIQINASLRAEVLDCLQLTPEAFDFESPQRDIAKGLQDQGIAHVDLLPMMKAEGAIRPLYKRFDTHWNLDGNIIAAREIGAALKLQMLAE